MSTSNDSGDAAPRFHTDTFEKMGPARREALLSVALGEFAANGFNGTSINALARKAGVSIGALYSYFPSKEDLFLTVVGMGRSLLAEALADLDPGEPFMDVYASLVRKARDYARANPELNLVYLDATTQGLRHLSSRLSGSLETLTVDFYYRAIAAAVERGELRRGLDVGAAAFCLDNILLLFQFSFASDYFRDRLRLFLGLGEGGALDEEAVMAAIVDFARRALRA
ncbi:MAG: TetR/AcrR family transcriptional regulator [Spirochaetes bacterium]|nr:TetR/AcrR family transcriptional regulator [Spirochaetota bacterium]MBU1080431.1 TetR/AcrR family transcriptional regulator [Spirochaetota bacterium]